MKILIVGGTSSTGRVLKPVLTEFSEVITAGRKNCDIYLDLTKSINDISISNDIDVVIHTAAHFGGKTTKEMLKAEEVNALGTLKLCNAIVEARVKHFILISSISVCVQENSEYFGIYAISKKHSEDLARFFCSKHSIAITILRPSQIYGNDDSFRTHQPFIYTMVDNAENNKDITIYGSNDALRNYIHVDDLTQIITKVIQQKVVGTYASMHPENLSYSQIAKAAFSAFNSKGRVLFNKEKPDIPDNIFEEDNSLYEKINYYPQISIDEGMRRIAKYRKARSNAVSLRK